MGLGADVAEAVEQHVEDVVVFVLVRADDPRTRRHVARNETIGTLGFNDEDGGHTTLAAAMSVVVATVAPMLMLRVVAPRLPRGVVSRAH